MTFTPNRQPVITFGCATQEPSQLNPWGHPQDYLRDPSGWVRGCFTKAKELGFKWIRFHMPGGHDGSELYKAGVFRDQEANDAAYEETELFKMTGGLVCVYTGKINPETARVILPTDGFVHVFDSWMDYGLARIEHDNTSTNPVDQLVLSSYWQSRGLESSGEWYPIKQISGGQWIFDSQLLHSCPWLILHRSAQACDPNRLWRVNPATSELRQLVYAPAFGSVEDAIAYVKDIKQRGQIADQLETEGVDPRVTEEILK